jgi:hypothetical protein
MKKALFFTLLLFIKTVSSIGQCCPFLGDNKIFPENPTSSDTIFLITDVGTPNQGEYLGYEILDYDSTILVKACYYDGWATSPSSFEDTISLGTKENGNYTVNFKAITSAYQDTCYATDSNSTELTFSVGGAEGINDFNNTFTATVYPNPSSNQVLVNSEKTVYRARLYNAFGNTVLEENIEAKKSFNLDTSSIVSGSYYLELTDKTGNTTTHKVMKL